MKDLQIFEYYGDGYKPMHDFGAWRVAFLHHGERFDIETMTELERHLETDEIFVLLAGEAFLLIGEEMRRVTMEYGRIYNVPAGIWHGISVSNDAKVLIVENADTTRANSERRAIKK